MCLLFLLVCGVSEVWRWGLNVGDDKHDSTKMQFSARGTEMMGDGSVWLVVCWEGR